MNRLHTRHSLIDDLRRLRVRRDSVLVVHSSFRAIGRTVGGPDVVVRALLDALGPSGTLVVPTHTTGLSDPSTWQHPPAPPEEWSLIRAEMPPYDALTTPSHFMGVIAECVRTWPGARRSGHPLVSFCALGAKSDAVVAGHRLDMSLGDGSPLARLYDLDADILLLGVGHDSNTSLHLGEYRAPGATRITTAAPLPDRGWVEMADIETREDLFRELGDAVDREVGTARGRVGDAACRLLPQRAAVDAATRWFTTRRYREHGRHGRR